ncbi:hypothetical protein [Legionella gresilensis]|uniref:hypothetical protein n=1 Tax=Legionella gresilensis TaxID=91823 RepID=UPI0010413FD9|nr:hypothetical protein [Legionella gresilensis]
MPSQTNYERLATLLRLPKLSRNDIKVALTLVSQLGQVDLERKDKHEKYLFDLAVEAQNAVIASAIISRYAELTKAELVAREAELIEIEGASLAEREQNLQSLTDFDKRVRQGALLKRDQINFDQRKASFAKAHPNFNYEKHMKKFASKFKPLEETYDSLLERQRQLKSLQYLAPLSIDFDNNDPLMQRYNDTSYDNLPPIMSRDFFKIYFNDLIDRQKSDYIVSIQKEINNLRIMGALKLIEVTKNLQLKNRLLTAISAYQRNPSDITLNKLNGAINEVIRQKRFHVDAEKEALTVLSIVRGMEETIDEFWHGKRNVQHPKLSNFIKETQSIITTQAQSIQSRGIREVLAKIGNILVSIFTSSKPFDERNDAEKQIDKVHERVQSGLTFFSNQVTQEQAKKPTPEFIKVSAITKHM